MNPIICVPKNVCEELDRALQSGTMVTDAGPDEVLFEGTIAVEGPPTRDSLEVDIKVVNSESGPYVDAVLFEDGREVYALEPCFDSVCGEYIFEVDDYEIVVQVAKS